MRLALTILIELPAGNHSVVVASAFLTLDRNRRKQRKSAGSLRFFGIYRYSQVQPNRAELNDNVLFVIDRHHRVRHAPGISRPAALRPAWTCDAGGQQCGPKRRRP